MKRASIVALLLANLFTAQLRVASAQPQLAAAGLDALYPAYLQISGSPDRLLVFGGEGAAAKANDAIYELTFLARDRICNVDSPGFTRCREARTGDRNLSRHDRRCDRRRHERTGFIRGRDRNVRLRHGYEDAGGLETAFGASPPSGRAVRHRPRVCS
jgi:hypothetical protein